MTSDAATLPSPAGTEAQKDRVVNDFVINVATANGSGSASSNTILFRSLFMMGIPVRSVNLFPSNIQGLPTWFTVRASKEGYVAHRTDYAITVCMNPETAEKDVMGIDPGEVCIYEASLKLEQFRDDLIMYPIPFKKLVKECCDNIKLRKLVTNILYDGILAHLLDIPMDIMDEAIVKQFGGKKKAVKLNQDACHFAFEWAKENVAKKDPYFLEKMDKTAGKIIVEGNESAGIGAMFHGCTVLGWYPITPSSSLCEAFISYAAKYRVDADGKKTYAVEQMEDELASAGVILGAGWGGARAMTATSGPGISLMSEFIGLGYFTETPAVFWNVQRVGPSTGLPTRTCQGDVLSTHTVSHGDCRHPVLFPANPNECFDMAGTAFDLAECYQTPVFVLSDLDLGMNKWMAEPFAYPTEPMKRGKVLSKADLEKLNGDWGRYRDVDGDAVPYRTLPGTDHPNAAWFARGSGHDENAKYTESAEEYVKLMDRLTRKFETIRGGVPKPVTRTVADNAKVGILAYGTSDPGVTEAQDKLNKQGLATDYMRIKALPLSTEVFDFIDAHDYVYLVEQNRDSQLKSILAMDTTPERLGKIRSVLHYNGIPLDAATVVSNILDQEKGA